MIIQMPAYDSKYFVANGIVMPTASFKVTNIYPINKNFNYILKLNVATGTSKLFRLNATYNFVTGFWKDTTLTYVEQLIGTIGIDMYGNKTSGITYPANPVDYPAQDNPIVDIHATRISILDSGYSFSPVGGHIG